METGQSISGKRRRLIEKSIRNMRKSEKLKKAQREADAKKARARAARDAEEQAFWERQYFRRADLLLMNRGDAAAATWTFSGDKSR